MKPKILPLIEECVEKGAMRGYHRAYKYTENPGVEQILDSISECIVSEFHERFYFDQKEYQE
jgi:hypothetical protein